MSWQCPECSFQNNDSMTRCVCGYELIEPDKHTNIAENQEYTKINWKRVLLEAFIIFIATALPTFTMSLLGGNIGSNGSIDLIEFKLKFFYMSLAIEYIGFIVIGCLHRNNRFRQLFLVALVLWLFSFSNFFIKPFSLGSIGKSFFHVMIAMVVGGAISFLFIRPKKKATK